MSTAGCYPEASLASSRDPPSDPESFVPLAALSDPPSSGSAPPSHAPVGSIGSVAYPSQTVIGSPRQEHAAWGLSHGLGGGDVQTLNALHTVAG